MPIAPATFDTIVALAVIEHVKDKVAFLNNLASMLKPDGQAAIVCTTPHPSVDWVHTVGATVGLFSHHASEEHETLLNEADIFDIARQSSLSLVNYQRFLFGANQLAVLQRKK